MNVQEIMKRYWFVLILAVLSIVFVGMYAVESQNNKELETLKDNDKYVIYSIDGENYYADDLYEELYTRYGVSNMFQALDRKVVDQLVETTKEMRNIATNNAQILLTQYDKASLDQTLRGLGFDGIDDLTEYFIYMQKNQMLTKEYLLANQAEHVDPYMEKHPRVVSHILVKVANVEKVTNEDGTTTLVAHPTEAEQSKLDEVLKQLEDNEFAVVAYSYSEDSSAQNGGSLGVIDDESSKGLVPEFAEVAMNLNEDEVSEVVLSQYGYHIIKCDANSVEKLLDSQDFISKIFNSSSDLYAKLIFSKADELNINILDETFKTEKESYMNESEDNK